MSYITTFSKVHFTPAAPKAADIRIVDIAHALSLLCRSNGHFQSFYSVAQHSLACAEEAEARGCSRTVRLACLLHDASEAYLSDITRPVKEFLPQYKHLEAQLQEAIYQKYLCRPLTAEESTQLTEIDDTMLYHEFRHFMGECLFASEPFIHHTPNWEFQDFAQVEQRFLDQFTQLCAGPEQESPNVALPPLHPTTRCIGVDGCKEGWIAVALHADTFQTTIFPTITELCRAYPQTATIFVDMPIGLWEHPDQRRPDSLLRKQLPKKASSVFNTPCRQAVYAASYEEAKTINKEILGVSMSKQSYYISPKIREIDQFLKENPGWKNRLVESHPEYCFALLNDNQPILASKQSPEGSEARLTVLSRYYPQSRQVLTQFLEQHPKKHKMTDDVLDALVLAVTQALGQRHGFTTLPEQPQKDPAGILMQIVGAKVPHS